MTGFERVVNVPKRSVGNTTIKIISEYAKQNSFPLEKSAKNLIILTK